MDNANVDQDIRPDNLLPIYPGCAMVGGGNDERRTIETREAVSILQVLEVKDAAGYDEAAKGFCKLLLSV
jgi:hypothetical protein